MQPQSGGRRRTRWRVGPAANLAAAALFSVLAGQASAATPGVPPQRVGAEAYSPSQSESGCVGGDTPGIGTFKALMERTYPHVAGNWGTYVCKGTSGHSVGRAWDWPLDVADNKEAPVGWQVINWLLATDEYGNGHAKARRLGVWYWIWDNKIWSSTQGPYAKRTYSSSTGSGAVRRCEVWDRTCQHLDHIHFSITVDAGAERTSAYVEHYMGPDSVSQQAYEQGVYYRSGANRNSTPRQYYRYWTPSSWWSSELNLGGVLKSGPSVTSWGRGRVDVFVRGTNDHLYHKWWDGSWKPSNSGWEGLGAPPGGMTSAPDAASWTGSNGNRHINVFVRGSDKALWMRTYNSISCPCGWSGWVSLGGIVTSNPGAVSRAPGYVDVFVRGTDNQMYHRRFTSGVGWSGWAARGGGLRGGPDVTAVGSKRLWVVVRGTDNRVYRNTWAVGGSWSGWSSLGYPQSGATSDPTALHRDGEYHVWVRSTDGRVWERYWTSSGGWSTWRATSASVSY